MTVQMYWDSCVVVYLVEGVSPWRQLLRERLLQRADAPVVCVSELVRLERRVQHLRNADAPMLQLFDEFFARTDVTLVDVTRQAWALATDLRARHRIRTPDALHLACAITAGADELWTNDSRLHHAAVPYLTAVNIQQPA